MPRADSQLRAFPPPRAAAFDEKQIRSRSRLTTRRTPCTLDALSVLPTSQRVSRCRVETESVSLIWVPIMRMETETKSSQPKCRSLVSLEGIQSLQLNRACGLDGRLRPCQSGPTISPAWMLPRKPCLLPFCSMYVCEHLRLQQ
jgi:hypothetical protein